MPRPTRPLELGISLIVGTFVLGAIFASPAKGISTSHTRQRGNISLNGLYDLLGTSSSMGVAAPHVTSAQSANAVTESKSAPSCKAPYGWLETQGVWIVEQKDPRCRIRLASVTWYGMQTTNWALAGLNFRTYPLILATIKRLGFNSIRIPLSDQLVRNNQKLHIKKKLVQANPNLTNLHPLQLLDQVIKTANQLGLMIILDNHFSIARKATDTSNHAEPKRAGIARVRSAKVDDNTIWDGGITEAEWINDWLTLANRYKSDSNVIGFDLRNEPHTNYEHHPHWSLHDYLTSGATWGPCPVKICGAQAAKGWNPSSNWVTAADSAGDAIQKVNSNLLLFVEGVQLFPNKSKYGVEAYWWGSILKGVRTLPIRFTVPNHLVYSPHEWGPWKCCMDFSVLKNKSMAKSYKAMAQIFNENWGFILTMKDPHPIWLGEFDTCNTKQLHAKPKIPKAVDCVYPDNKSPSQGKWFQILLQYLKYHPYIGWAYYPINGTNAEDEPSSNSILDQSWKGAQLGQLMTALKPLEKQPAPAS